MKRRLLSLVLAAVVIAGTAGSADAGLFFHHRVVYRPVVVSPVYVAPVQPVLYAPPPPVVYRAAPAVYPAYYVPARAYYAPTVPVYVGW